MNTLLWLIPFVSSALILIAVWFGCVAFAPLWDRAATTQLRSLTERCLQLGLDEERLRLFLRCWGLAMILVFFLLWFVLRMPPVAVACTILAYVAPRHILAYLIRRRTRTLRNQLVTASAGLANAAKAGLSVAQGLETVCEETPQPLANELQRVVFEFERGRPLREAMGSIRERLKLEAFTVFALAIETSLECGGRINEALERLSASMQEQQRLERKLEADTAAGRQVVLVLSLFPVVFLGVFYLLSPESTGLLFTTLLGQCVLVVAMALVYFGCLWASRMLRIEI